MKYIFSLLLLFLFASCSERNGVPKPDKSIDETVMENILYDLTLLQALKNYSPQELKENKVNPKTYIYQKYKIDSLQFAQNSKYFASNTEEYKLMFDRIVKRIEVQKATIDTILKKEEKIKAKKIKDSIVKQSKKSKKVVKTSDSTINQKKKLLKTKKKLIFEKKQKP